MVCNGQYIDVQDRITTVYTMQNAGHGRNAQTMLPTLQAMELEEFRALERQIIKDAGSSVRASAQSLPQVSNRHVTSRQQAPDIRSASHRVQHSPNMHAAHQTEQAISQQQQPEALYSWHQQQYAPATTLHPQEPYAPAFPQSQAPPLRTAQPKRNISGNPFADPEPFAENSSNLYAQSPSVNLTSPAQPVHINDLGGWPPLPVASEQTLKQRAFAALQSDETWEAAGSGSAVQPAQPKNKQASKPVITD